MLTNQVSHINRGDTLYYNGIQRRVSAGNQKWKENDKGMILMIDAKKYLNKGKLTRGFTQLVM